MIDPKQRAELDQSLSLMMEVFPSQWRQMYLRLLEEGFQEAQALELVKTYIRATFGNSSS